MPVPNFAATVDHFASRLAADHTALARLWLERLDQLLSVEKRDVFPTHQLLDHIPDLLKEIASYLRAPADQEIAANTAVMSKAAELGLLRFDQRASVHQLLREYQILSEILEAFFAREAAALGERGDATAAVLVAEPRAAGRARPAAEDRRRVHHALHRDHRAADGAVAQLQPPRQPRDPPAARRAAGRWRASCSVREAEPETARLVETLERNVVRLGEVAGKLERLARLTRRPDNAPNEQQVDLAAVVNDVAGQLRDMAEARGVVFEVDPELPTLAADAGRVELVVMNLLANAIKYSDPDKPARRVSVERADVRRVTQVRIRDNGIGIPKSKLDTIFDQFVRAHAHLDDELGAQGLGLGLAIVRESMEAMGGIVTVESVERRRHGLHAGMAGCNAAQETGDDVSGRLVHPLWHAP